MFVILRHAEPRRSESDPELTSAGHRMALDAAAWVVDTLPAEGSVQVHHTPTARTRQTAEAVAQWLAERVSLHVIEALPETLPDLHMLADRLSGARPGLPVPAMPPTVLVGHHTTLVALARELPADQRTPSPHRFAAGLALQRDPTTSGGWRVVALWPGRLGG